MKEQQIEQERAKAITEVSILHTVLVETHKRAAQNNPQMRTNGQDIHNARTHVLLINSQAGNYPVIRSRKCKRHKLSSEWVSPLRIINMKSESVYVMEYLNRVRQEIVEMQRLIPYPVHSGSSKAPAELTLQSEYLVSGLQLVDHVRQ